MGPTLGGWITDNYNWRWIFLINVPVGICLVFLVMALIKEPRTEAGATPQLRGRLARLRAHQL